MTRSGGRTSCSDSYVAVSCLKQFDVYLHYSGSYVSVEPLICGAFFTAGCVFFVVVRSLHRW